ncbi:MAG: hypothetical protein JWO91_1207 [Acidobacteriaceae bacterium]|jgi:uncharacterized membrane protein|nr:hypothetical protein [Acidobacteriaceae bacterium]
MSRVPSSRLAYIDWLRGLACLLMFQTHCYDAWLSDSAKKSTFFMWSQLGGTLPAPLFLFLAGISVALVVDKLGEKGKSRSQVAKAIVSRGAEIFALGILFRLQEYLIAWGWAPWTDLLRVDVLNTIGLSMMLLGLTTWIATSFAKKIIRRICIGIAATTIALSISLLTPMLWTRWAPHWLPWPVESYVNGVHNLGQPQAWLFPIFPWAGFAFAGLAVGSFLQTDFAKKLGAGIFAVGAFAGLLLFGVGHWLDVSSAHLYPIYDYWHTSPAFFLARVGILLVILASGYGWFRWGAGQWGFSPLVQLGQTSLLVYWVHLEFVYGRLSILPRKLMDIRAASLGLLTIFLAMLVLSIVRTGLKGRREKGLGTEQHTAVLKAPTVAG